MSDITATVLRPLFRPIATISSANSRASFSVVINAPLPVLTSSTMAWAPAANFLLIIELAINALLATVPVTSRILYSFPSAGARLAD